MKKKKKKAEEKSEKRGRESRRNQKQRAWRMIGPSVHGQMTPLCLALARRPETRPMSQRDCLLWMEMHPRVARDRQGRDQTDTEREVISR